AITQAVTVHPLPVSIFTNDTVCGLITMPFLDGSTVTSGTITGWQWYFGDGNVSNVQNTSHVYASGGNYTTSLVVTTALGCQDSSALNVVVYPKPVVDFIAVDACLNDINSFTDQSTIVGSQLTGWNWDFGDNTGTSTQQDPTYLYGTSGQYTVELITTTADGCMDTIEQTVDVHDLPVADFTFIDICEDDSIQFVDLSTIPSGAINSWEWDFGNGNTASVVDPDYQHYPADAIYPVTLIVSSGFGCSDTLEDAIEIFPVPVAEFTFDSACFPLEIQFTDLSNENGAYGLTSWVWEFSDGQTSNQQSPSMDFGMPGTFSAQLLITNSVGCKSTFNAGDAVVHPVPVAEFPQGLATCFEDTIFFEDQSSIIPITDDVIDTWSWTFDDGNTSDQPSPFHVYGAHDLYDVAFSVTSNHGCTHSVTRMVEVYPLPQIAFTALPPEGCQPFDVAFDNQTTIESGYFISDFYWDLGNGVNSTTQSPQTTYVDSGMYDV
ncbi:MAG: PKD domain-containing protein, partial [Flavobacteriales bacterium]|nr:PKD domain-containing protein [Flavobacteriales bacterium]